MKIEFKYAALISFLLFLWLCLEFWLGFHDAYVDYLPYTSVFTALVWGVALSFEIRARKKTVLGSYWSYGKGFKTAFLTTLLALPMLLLSRWIFYDLINPDFFNNLTIKGREWISATAPTEENFDNSIKMMEDFLEMKAYQGTSVVLNFLTGLLFSLVLPLFGRRTR